MNTHLTDEDLAAAVAGHGVSSQAAKHLSSCMSCRQEVAELQQSIAERRQGMDGRGSGLAAAASGGHGASGGSNDGPSRLAARRWLRPFLAAAAVLVVAVGVGLLMPHGAATPSATDDLAIEQILAEVDAVLADDSLPGFESIDLGVDDPESYFENGAS